MKKANKFNKYPIIQVEYTDKKSGQGYLMNFIMQSMKVKPFQVYSPDFYSIQKFTIGANTTKTIENIFYSLPDIDNIKEIYDLDVYKVPDYNLAQYAWQSLPESKKYNELNKIFEEYIKTKS